MFSLKSSVSRIFHLTGSFVPFQLNKVYKVSSFRFFSLERLSQYSISSHSIITSRKYSSNLCENIKTDAMAKNKKAFQRLSKDVKPTNYKLSLLPDLVKLVFTCDEDITLQVIFIPNLLTCI